MGKALIGLMVGVLGAFVLALLMVVLFPLTMLHAYIVQDMWYMFVTPSLGVAAPGFWYCVGLLYFVGLFTTKSPKKETSADKEASEEWTTGAIRLLSPTLAYLIVWGMGNLIYTLFIN